MNRVQLAGSLGVLIIKGVEPIDLRKPSPGKSAPPIPEERSLLFFQKECGMLQTNVRPSRDREDDHRVSVLKSPLMEAGGSK